MQVIPTKIPGCYELQPRVLKDQRGYFVKTFHRDIFAENGLETCFAEEYYSFSYQGVLRGLHFQLPPYEHTKLVYCVLGNVLDVVVDLRIGSPTVSQFVTFELSAEKANVIYIPTGLAHGFYVQSTNAIMIYQVTTVYSPEHDSGIRWDSVGIPWPHNHPILSGRDRKFVSLAGFQSPFEFNRVGRDA